jgi:hypothetical protein
VTALQLTGHAEVHDVGDVASETFATVHLPILGPTCVALLQHAARRLAIDPVIDTTVEAVGAELGITQPSKMQYALTRLSRFHFVYLSRTGDGQELLIEAQVRMTWPRRKDHHDEKLPPVARAAYDAAVGSGVLA